MIKHLPLLFQVNVLSFTVDSENNIWMATREGLVKYNESKPIKWFNNYEYGFYVTECTSSVLDRNGDIWVTTLGGGLVKLMKSAY
jgi:ligand-binding sensor domain-containing protein